MGPVPHQKALQIGHHDCSRPGLRSLSDVTSKFKEVFESAPEETEGAMRHFSACRQEQSGDLQVQARAMRWV